MKEGWKEVKLGDIVTLKNGYSFKSSEYDADSDGEYKIITIKNVTGDRYINTNTCNTISFLPSNIRSHQVLKEGDILISMTGNVGRVSMVNEDKCLLNQRVGLLDLMDSNFDKEFIFQLLSTTMFQEAMIDRGHGAAQPNIGKDDIESFIINVPEDIEEQKRIANILKNIGRLSDIHSVKADVLSRMKEHLMNNKYGIIEKERSRSEFDRELLNLQSKVEKNIKINFSDVNSNNLDTRIRLHRDNLDKINYIVELITYIGEDKHYEREREFNS